MNNFERLISQEQEALRLDMFEAPIVDGWRQIFADGPTAHPAGDFIVDAQFKRHVIESFEYMRDEYGYYPPIAVEHEIEVEFPDVDGAVELKGTVLGIVAELADRNGGLWCRPRYTQLAQKLRDAGALLYVSPSFYPEYTDPHTGRVLRNLLREVTHCSVPHQKNLETPVREVYALSEAGFTSPTNHGGTVMGDKKPTSNMEEEVENMEEAEAPEWALALIDMVSELKKAVVEMAKPSESADDEKDEVAMSEKLEALRYELAEARAEADIRRHIPDAGDELVKDLAAIKLSDEERYARMLDLVQERQSETAPLGTTGATGSRPATNLSGRKAEVSAIFNSAAKEGVKRGPDFVRFVRARGVSHDELDAELINQAYAGRSTK